MSQYNGPPDLNEILKDIKTRLQALANTVPAATVQPGDLIPSAAATRTGCLLADGRSYPTANYPGLFHAIGYTYGGSGPDFNVPDMRGRAPIGAGTGAGLSARALGQTGGAETHLLLSGESGVPGHTHPPASGTFFLESNNTIGTAAGAVALTLSTVHAATGSNTAANASAAHNNMQPFEVVNWFIKT